MFIYAIVGVAAFVDGLATGVWFGKKIGTKTVTQAVETAAERAITIPSGGLKTIAAEVAAEAEAVVARGTEVATEVGAAVQSAEDLKAKLDGLIAATKK